MASTLELLTAWLTRDTLSRTDVDTLLRALTNTSVRDAAIAVATGRPDDATDLLEGTGRSHRWVMVGPLHSAAIAVARPHVDQLETHSRRAGAAYTYAPTTIGAYLDWVSGEALTATLRLADIPNTYALARWIKHHLAFGTPPPVVVDDRALARSTR